MKYAARVGRTQSEGSNGWLVHRKAKEMAAAGEDVILLTIGDPDFDTPKPIVDSLVDSIRGGRTHYTWLMGEAPLREAVAAFHTQLTGQNVTMENVGIMPGAQGGLFAAAMCTLSPGDEVIVMDPVYSTYGYFCGAAGATIVPVPLRVERNFLVDPDEIEAAVTPRTRAIILNTPHNPTGAIVHKAEMEAIGAICQKHDLWLIGDEVYGSITYDHPHVSAASLPHFDERTITVSSLSKSHSMTGWRLGWVVGPTELMGHVGNLSAGMVFGMPGFIQDAATVALTDALGEVDIVRERYRTRRDMVIEALSDAPGISVNRPEAGLYMLVDVRASGLSATDFGFALLEAEKVAMLPGTAFGPNLAGHMRLSLTAPDDQLAEACRRIARFASNR